MKSLFLFLLFMNALLAEAADNFKPCIIWQEKIDLSVKSSGDISTAATLSPKEKIHAISCLLALKGNQGKARIGGATSIEVSQLVPPVSVEVAALFYIRYLYYGKWQHSGAIALQDWNKKFNTKSSVKKAYASYQKWFDVVQQIGIEKAMELGLDPMDECIKDGVRWNGQYEWDYLTDQKR